MASGNDMARPRHGYAATRPTQWHVAWGVFLIVAGSVAVLMPGIAALATALVLGWLLLLAGGFEVGYALHTRGQQGFGWKLGSGLITLLLGLLIVALPVAGAASLALLVAAFLLTGGFARIVLALHVRPRRGWRWVLMDGLLSIVLAILIAMGWPASSLAFIGLLTGFALIASGLWRIVLRRAPVR